MTCTLTINKFITPQKTVAIVINSTSSQFSWKNVSIYVLVSSMLFYGIRLHPPEIYSSDVLIRPIPFVLPTLIVTLIFLLLPLVLPAPILFSRLGEKLTQRYPRIFSRNPSQNKAILILYLLGIPLYLIGNPSTYEATSGDFPYWLFRMEPYIKSVTAGPFYILFDSISQFSAPYAPTILVIGFGAILSGFLVWAWITVLSWMGIGIIEIYEGLVNKTWKHVAVFVIVLGVITTMAGVYIFFPTYLSGVEKAPPKETPEPPQSLSDESVKPWLKNYAENTTHNEIIEDALNSDISHLTGADVQCLSPTLISESSEGMYATVDCAGVAEYTYNWGLLHYSLPVTNSKQIYFVNESVVKRIRKPVYDDKVLRPGTALSNVDIQDGEVHVPDSHFGAINLTGSTLTNVTLQPERSLDLSYSSLNNVTLRHDNIRLVNLTGSDIRDSRIKENNPEAKSFVYSVRDASFRDTRLVGLSLEFADIENTVFRNVQCLNCNLRRATFTDVKISDSDYVDSNIESATLSEVDISDTEFNRTRFSEATFNKVNIKDTEFVDSSVYNTEMISTNVKNTVFDTERTGITERNTTFTNVTVRGEYR